MNGSHDSDRGLLKELVYQRERTPFPQKLHFSSYFFCVIFYPVCQIPSLTIVSVCANPPLFFARNRFTQRTP